MSTARRSDRRRRASKASTSRSDEWLARSNAVTLYHLERQGRTDLGLIPFLGAGISLAFGFKDWRGLLLAAAPPRIAARLERRLLEKNDYEGAAELLLRELGDDGFQNMVAAAAGDGKIDSSLLCSGTVSLLPLLATGPVVTTNFDRILEHAFVANGTPFDAVISGPRPDLIVDALHGNRRVLIKLHGDWQDRVGRTFARSDYDTNYGKAQPEKKRELLTGAERLLFASRSLLFVGASLGPDRTVRLLEDVHESYAGIRHFAIMSVPATQTAFAQKAEQLQRCGVLPLWYRADDPDDHQREVARLLARIIERISVQTTKEPTAERRAVAPASRRRVSAAPTRSADMVPPAVHILPGLDTHLDRVARLAEDGRLTFVLGSAIHAPTMLLAEEFYREMARVFECEALVEEGAAVLQYIADRHGRESLNREVRTLIERTPQVPRETHELFAAWPTFRTAAGDQVPYPTVITTNFDDVLETRLDSAGLPYHLLSYQSDGAHRGLFYHRTPDGGLRIIERPRNIRHLSDGLVLVKLNGGLGKRDIPESYTVTRLDYWNLAARIPDVLPATLQRTLSENPLLFLGHGLRLPDIEALVRFAHRRHPGLRSWAVVLGHRGVEYWRQCGVELLDQSVNAYVTALWSRLARKGGGRSGGK